MTPFVQAFIGLGSNLDEPAQQLDAAIGWLQSWSGISLLAVSGYYRSAPIGPQDQPDFVNAVAEISTNLSPMQLLSAVQEIEARQGRERSEHWGPRTLDLDILLYGELVIREPELTIPHPQMASRAFVLAPLMDLAPEAIIDGKPISVLLETLAHQTVEPL